MAVRTKPVRKKNTGEWRDIRGRVSKELHGKLRSLAGERDVTQEEAYAIALQAGIDAIYGSRNSSAV